MRRSLIVVGPTPPPYHGVTVSTTLVLGNAMLEKTFRVEHLDTSDPRTGANIGRWDRTNLRLGLASAARLRAMTRSGAEPGVVYLPISQGAAGFARDALLIHVARRRGWKVAVHLRGSEFRSFYENSPLALRRVIRRTLSRVDSVAVLGNTLRGVFGDLVPSDRIAVVANGTPEPGPASPKRESAHVLFLSNLRRRKGVVEAVDSALKVVDRVPGATFTFAGAWEDAPLERELREKSASAGDAVVFLGPVTGGAKADLLGRASVLLFPPKQPEGHPRVVLEALAAGLPVVTTDRGAIAETVEDGVSGYVLPDPDADLLAERLVGLLTDDDLRSRMSRAARDRYLAEFTQDRADEALARWLAGVAGLE